MELVRLSQLQLIQTPEEYFGTGKVLAVDVLCVGDSPSIVREHVKDNLRGFVYNKQIYLPMSLKGSPENVMRKLKNGLKVSLPFGVGITAFMENSLEQLIQQKKIYRFDREYTAGEVSFAQEIDFLIDRYILNKV